MEEKRPRRIALLFLANNGISQPEIWREWRSKLPDGENKIVFFGIMPKKEKGWIQIPLTFPTQWCDKSLVLAEQIGLKAIQSYDPYETIQHVFFISGDSVPTKSAKYVYEQPDVTELDTFHRREAKNTPHFEFQGASQWKSYRRKDLNDIATFDFQDPRFVQFDQLNGGNTLVDRLEQSSVWNKFKSLWTKELKDIKEDKQHIPLINSYKYWISVADRQIQNLRDSKLPVYNYPYACPDEFWIPSVLQSKGNKFTDTRIMGLSKPQWGGLHTPHPLEWTNWETSYTEDNDEASKVFDLRDELIKNCKLKRPFYRKVSKTLIPKATWELCV